MLLFLINPGEPIMTFTRRTVVAAAGATLLAGPIRAQGRDATPAAFKGKVFVNERGGLRIHTYLADPAGAMVTSHIVETTSGLVLIDGQFMPAQALELKSYVASLGKPLLRVILSHGHPDHWFGFHQLGLGPVHAGPITGKFITENGTGLVAARKAESSAPAIGGVIAEGDETIGGVLFRFRHVLNTEAPEITTVEIPAAGAFIVQDIVYNKVHAVVSRQIDQWVAALRSIEARRGETPLILAGHGEPTSPESLAGLVKYLETVKPLIAANIGKEDQAKAITDEMAKAFPDYRVPGLLTFGLSSALKA
jgi:glyoxylase-like metal-dependent hydrolase (beta-lactamase superfamily II)